MLTLMLSSFLLLDPTAAKPAVPPTATRLADLPVAIASFGGAVQDGWLYVLGGHVGRKHEHSVDNLSDAFVRRRIDEVSAWETLPACTPLQSVSLVSDGQKLYRVGGMRALNAPGQPEDLHSVDQVACFDPATLAWSELPPLPEPRSSHDAVVIDNRLYVLCGWCLNGDSLDARWFESGYVLDLTESKKWQPLPPAPFQRRAVAAAALGNSIYVLGGIDHHGKTSSRVDVLHLDNGTWSRGPDLPFNGFGVSAFSLREKLYANGMESGVFRLNVEDQVWEVVARLTEDRFFHRLLPAGGERLLFVGGANKSGHLTSVEMLDSAVLQRSVASTAESKQ